VPLGLVKPTTMSSLKDLQHTGQHRSVGNRQASRQAGLLAGRQAGRQASGLAAGRAGWQTLADKLTHPIWRWLQSVLLWPLGSNDLQPSSTCWCRGVQYSWCHRHMVQANREHYPTPRKELRRLIRYK
jgi:hypothetical protein